VNRSAQDLLNRATWAKASSRRWLDGISAFTDPGERAGYDYVAERVRGRPILDLGVGTGRTIEAFRALSSDYVGIDYLPSMVEASRRQHPDARVELGDARSLADQSSNCYALVNFSFNGIDAVSPADRQLVLRSVHRVLAPGGLFFFSTLNLDGPAYRRRPWQLDIQLTLNPARLAVRLGRTLVRASIDLYNWMQIRDGGERGPGFAVAPLSAHNYRVLVHYTTLHRQLAELAEAGFAGSPLVFDSLTGRRVDTGDDTSAIGWFHFVATRP
jgi:SAM-dependent methyltransferase